MILSDVFLLVMLVLAVRAIHLTHDRALMVGAVVAFLIGMVMVLVFT